VIYIFPPHQPSITREKGGPKKQHGTTSSMIRSFFAITTFQRPRDVPSTARNLEIDEEMANLGMMNQLPRNKPTQLLSNLWGKEMSNNLETCFWSKTNNKCRFELCCFFFQYWK